MCPNLRHDRTEDRNGCICVQEITEKQFGEYFICIWIRVSPNTWWILYVYISILFATVLKLMTDAQLATCSIALATGSIKGKSAEEFESFDGIVADIKKQDKPALILAGDVSRLAGDGQLPALIKSLAKVSPAGASIVTPMPRAEFKRQVSRRV